MAQASEAGADIRLAENRCDGDIPNEMVMARTEPEMVAKAPVMTACSSDLVK